MALVVLPKQLMVDGSGNPRSGAKAYFYQSGTTTPITVYTTSDYSVAHSNPVIANASGLFPAVYINPTVNPTYKLVVTDSSDVEIYSEDNIPALGFTQSDVGATLYPRTAAEIAAGVTPVNFYIPRPELYLSRYGAAGDGVTDDTDAIRNAIKVANASGRRLIFDGLTYRISNYLPFYSGMQWVGAYENTTLQLSGNHRGIVSASYVSALGASILGRGHIENLRVKGANTGATPETAEVGVTIHDYYTILRNVTVEECAYGGFEWLHTNDAGTPAGGTLVENRMENCIARLCGGVLFYIGAEGNGKLTDGFMRDCLAQAGATTTQCLFIGHAAGWLVDGLHTYGTALAYPIEVVPGFATRLVNLYVESFKTAGVLARNAQEGFTITGNFVGSSADAGADAVRISRSGAYSNVPALVDIMVKGGANAINGLNIVNSSMRVLGRVIPYGANASNVTPVVTSSGDTTEVQTPDVGGTFTATLTGVSTTTTGTAHYRCAGKLVSLYLPQLIGTSNATSCTITGMPAAIRPARKRSMPLLVQDNGALAMGWCEIDTSGTLTLYPNANLGAFTASGSKGVRECSLTYSLD